MSKVIEEIYTALEQLRETLRTVNVSTKVREQLEELLTPLFENTQTRQRMTDIVNQVGDFSENILVPLLEQYVSANVATRVRFLVEDLLEYIENYRDQIVKKIELKAKQFQNEVSAATLSARGGSSRRLAINSVTNHYRAALHGSKGDQKKGKLQLKNVRSHSTARLGRSGSVNVSFRVVDTVREQASFRPREVGVTRSENLSMAALVVDNSTKTLTEVPAMGMPQMTKSGQVLIKVLAVGLNHMDKARLSGNSTLFRRESGQEAPQLTQMRALGETVMSMAGAIAPNASFGGRSARLEAAVPEEGGDERESDVLGIEFCGQVKDIAWQRGDFLHTMHVSREDIVYGVLRQSEGSSAGALGEYLVCDVQDVVRCPRRISSPKVAASLGLDGAVVCNALAGIDITNPRGTTVLVIGAATNPGMILLELLSKDLGVPMRNIHTLSSEDQFGFLSLGGVTSNNMSSYNATEEEWLRSLDDRSLDVIFDCRTESNYASGNAMVNFEKVLTTKKKRTVQFVTINSSRFMADKKARNEDWQKELKLLNSLFETRKLTLTMFAREDDNEAVDFAAGAVTEALEQLKTGAAVGKLVVEVNERNLDALKARARGVAE